jgi:hypothetical protein
VAKDWKGASIVEPFTSVQDHTMSTEKSSRFTVELETGADPIRGSIEHLDGSRQPFWGWLELIEALQRAAGDQSESTPSQPRVTGQSSTPDASDARREPQTPGKENP